MGTVKCSLSLFLKIYRRLTITLGIFRGMEIILSHLSGLSNHFQVILTKTVLQTYCSYWGPERASL